jgi:hypothetical protein
MPLVQTVVAAALFAGGLVVSHTPIASAKKTVVFACTEHEGRLATVVQTKRGNVPLLYWDSQAFSGAGYNPELRCRTVTSRFRSRYNSGQLKYLATGRVNNQPVICGTASRSTRCSSSNMLFTLKPGADPRSVLQQINAVRNRAAGSAAVEESAAPVPNNPSTDDMVDLNDWLDFADR